MAGLVKQKVKDFITEKISPATALFAGAQTGQESKVMGKLATALTMKFMRRAATDAAEKYVQSAATGRPSAERVIPTATKRNRFTGWLRRNVHTEKPSPKAIRTTFWRWQATRLILTIIVVVYAAIMIIVYLTRGDADEAGRDKLKFIQHVLWGDSGILGFLSLLWIFSLIILLVYPVIEKSVAPLIKYFLGPEGLVG